MKKVIFVILIIFILILGTISTFYISKLNKIDYIKIDKEKIKISKNILQYSKKML